MLLPFLLIAIAGGAATVMAFGTNPDLAQYTHGLGMIVWTRRLQWPLVTVSLVCCLGLLALVISGKRRAWWLIALGPITGLFFYRFSLSSDNFFSIAENPAMLSVDEASFIRDDDWVVGVMFDEQAYALPYAALYSTPLVIQAEREKRMALLWSPFANLARAFVVDREFKSRELDIISMPANAILVYNQRNGEFINGLTGLTVNGSKPASFKVEIPTQRTSWRRWRESHPDTRVMVASGRLSRNPPAAPVLPLYPLPAALSGPQMQRRIAFVPATQPAAVAMEAISSKPLNLLAGKMPVLVFRDPSGRLRAFDRRIDEDLMPRFELNRDLRRKLATFVDSDTNTGWSLSGLAVDGDKNYKGKQLKALIVEEDLYWGVMKYWYPNLELAQ